MKTMKIAVATTTRADWGLLSPLASELRRRGHEVQVLAANMHFNPELGMTVREIEADGFLPALRCDVQGSPVVIASACLLQYAEALARLKPACMICLGDRFEMLAIAQAAVMSGVPIVHIAGGAVSEGASDDMFRHAITKLSWLHFTECEDYRRRVVSMGEDPARVFDTGAIGVHNILSISLMDKAVLETDIDFALDRDTLLCTMHAATLEPVLSPVRQYACLLEGLSRAMDSKPSLRLLFTYPNNDVDPAPLIAAIHEFAARYPRRVRVIPALGMRRYLSALHYVGGVIGNSSSGIVEVSSAGVPVLDIGIRQQGRMRAPSVIHADCDAGQIALGVERLFSPSLRALASRRENPYYNPDTLTVMADAIENTDFSQAYIKPFYQPCATSI